MGSRRDSNLSRRPDGRSRIRSIVSFIAVCGVAIASSAAEGNQRFDMVGWQLHNYDMPRIEEAIERAPEYNVNFLIFSHGLVGAANQVLAEEQRRRDLQHLTELANEKGIKTYLWLHELNGLPEEFYLEDGRLDLDRPGIEDFLRDRYLRLFDAMPDTDGVVISFHESGSRVFRNTECLSKLPVPERFRKVIRPIYEVCRERDRTLILRMFFYEPFEREWFREAMETMPVEIILMNKNTPHEFNPYYPFDPMFGDFPGRPMIMEVDLTHENAPSSEVPFMEVEYIGASLDHAAAYGAVGIVGRARFTETQGFQVPDEINYYAFGRFAEEPPPDPDRVWDDWLALHYPAEARPHLRRAFGRTFEICRMLRYNLRFWAYPRKGYRYALGKILERSLYKWTHDPADLEMQEALYNPSDELFAELLAEKDHAIAETVRSRRDLDLAAPYLTEKQLAPIQKKFDALLEYAQIRYWYTQAFWGFRRWINDPTEEKEAVVREAVAELRRWGFEEHAEEYEAMLADRDAALEMEKERMAEVRARLKPR